MENPFQILTVRHEDGERLSILLDRMTRLPICFANEYILYVRRNRLSSNALKKDLHNLSYFLWWGKASKIDIVERLKTGMGFSIDEISMQIFPWMRRSFTQSSTPRLAVERRTAQERMNFILGFMKWHLNSLISSLPPSDVRIANIQIKIKSLNEVFGSLKYVNTKRAGKEALTLEQQSRLLEICHPDYSDNPWSPDVRKRNYLVLLILISFGIRRGELLKIYVSDCRTYGERPEIRIRRRPDDPNDTRHEEPNVKTLERVLPLSPTLSQHIDSYIQNVRSKTRQSRKHPFLIVSRRGDAMALQTMNAIFKQVGERFKEFQGLHPHILRHTANTRLTEKAKEKNISSSDLENHLKYINGWQGDNSATYTQLEIRKEASRLAKEHQRTILS